MEASTGMPIASAISSRRRSFRSDLLTISAMAMPIRKPRMRPIRPSRMRALSTEPLAGAGLLQDLHAHRAVVGFFRT